MCAIYTSIQTKIAYYRYTFIIRANTTKGTNKRTKQTNNGYAVSQGIDETEAVRCDYKEGGI